MALKIVFIILKLVQIVLLAIGMGFVAYFTNEVHNEATEDDPNIDPYDYGTYGRNEFFLYSTGVGVGIAVLGIVCAIIGLLEKKHGAFAMFAVQAIWTLQLLVATALVAKILTTLHKEEEDHSGVIVKLSSNCETWDKAEDRDYEHTCGQLTGGVVCGFFAMVVFAVDAVVSLVSYTRASS